MFNVCLNSWHEDVWWRCYQQKTHTIHKLKAPVHLVEMNEFRFFPSPIWISTSSSSSFINIVVKARMDNDDDDDDLTDSNWMNEMKWRRVSKQWKPVTKQKKIKIKVKGNKVRFWMNGLDKDDWLCMKIKKKI